MATSIRHSIPKIAVIGAGYWGKNLVKKFYDLSALNCVCDTREDVLREMQTRYGVRTTGTLDTVLADTAIQAVAIAAPAAEHYNIAKRCLLQNKHVYVEKPLALRVEEGQELVELASSRGKILMVGHILEYHPAIIELKRLIREGELGKIQYIYSTRVNLGKLRSEENILWSFAPHDISAILHLLEEMPVRVSTSGGSFLNPQIPDTTLTICDFKSGVKAHIFVSWLHPFKEQKLCIVGDKKMAVFDDMEKERKLVLYSHRIDWLDRVPVAHRDGGQAVLLPSDEPLLRECEHFLECAHTHSAPRTGGQSAMRVLRVLDACERSLRGNGNAVDVDARPSSYYAHPTAVIDDGCVIGEGSKIWHFSHIMRGAMLGKKCNLGQNVVVSPGCIVGNNVKIQNNVSVYTGVELEDDVFCGPSMVFTNVINPRSHIERKSEYRKTLVKKGASIGANATIVCGTTIGRYSFIAAGAVVTRDVPDHALMMGVPAVPAGWVCYCGNRLINSNHTMKCNSCARQYRIEKGQCSEVTDRTNRTPAIEIPAAPIAA